MPGTCAQTQRLAAEPVAKTLKGSKDVGMSSAERILALEAGPLAKVQLCQA